MNSSRISYNIHGQNVPDMPRLLQHLQAIQPYAVLVMDNLGLAKELKALLPRTLVIFRAWPDDAIHQQMTPEQWIQHKLSETGGSDLWLYTSNEPGFGDDLLDWTSRLIELTAPRGMKLVVGNFSVGTPRPEEWERPAAVRLLRLLDQHRQTVILGLHEYACGVITSGFIGGEPQFIAPHSWPQTPAALTKWHCGRFSLLVSVCHRLGIGAPRIVLTEHGFDDVSDIKPWAERLLRDAPYLNVRGWKSLRSQWNAWFGGLAWSPERAYFEQLAYADRAIYQQSPVEAQLIFSWGYSSRDWEQFDISQAFEFQSLLENYARQGVPTPAPVVPRAVPPSPTAPGFAPIGVRSPEELARSATPSQPQPSVPPVRSEQLAAPAVESAAGITLILTPEEAQAVITGFRTAAASGLFGAAVSAAFAAIAAALERGQGSG